MNLPARVALAAALLLPVAVWAQPLPSGASLSGPPLVVRPQPPSGAPAEAPTGSPSFEDLVMELVNVERLANGALAPLKRVNLIDNSSETHSSNMATRNFFSHCDLDTLTMPWDRMVAAGYNGISAAENIAAGYTTPAAVMAGWMASAGHRANILGGTRELGIGYVLQGADAANVRLNTDTDCDADQLNQGPYLHYWTQNFGTRSGVYPVVIEREAFETASPNVDLYLYGPANASERRLRNENGAFGAWQPFSNNVAWQLSPGDGEKTVFAEVRNASLQVFAASDTILLTGQGNTLFTDGFESGNLSAWDAVVP
jgi:uncharacterized protein YkwD